MTINAHGYNSFELPPAHRRFLVAAVDAVNEEFLNDFEDMGKPPRRRGRPWVPVFTVLHPPTVTLADIIREAPVFRDVTPP